MNRENPFISVIVTAYNRERYIEQCLNSVLSQTLNKSDYEIIVIKNFSSRIDELQENQNLTILHSDAPEIGPKLLQAIEKSRGQIIAFMEDDDLWLPDKLLKVSKIFQENTRLGYYHNSYTFIDENGDIIESDFRSGDRAFRNSYRKFLWKPGYPIKVMHQMRDAGAFFNMSSITIRRKALTQNMQYLKQLGFTPDFFVFFSAICSGMEILADSDPLTLYRITHTSTEAKGKPGNTANSNKDWQLDDRHLILDMVSKCSFNGARSMVEYELTDFLSLRLIRQSLRMVKPFRKKILAYLRQNKGLYKNLLIHSRYMYKNLFIITLLLLSPRLGKFLIRKNEKNFLRK